MFKAPQGEISSLQNVSITFGLKVCFSDVLVWNKKYTKKVCDTDALRPFQTYAGWSERNNVPNLDNCKQYCINNAPAGKSCGLIQFWEETGWCLSWTSDATCAKSDYTSTHTINIYEYGPAEDSGKLR